MVFLARQGTEDGLSTVPRVLARTRGKAKRLVSRLPWGHVIPLLQRLKEPEVREWHTRESIKSSHAKHGEDEVTIEIETGQVAGTMRPRPLAMIQEWRELHRDESRSDWSLAEQRKQINPMPFGVMTMILHVLEAKHLHDYVIHLRFNDGSEGQVDLKDELGGEVFEPLRDLDKFKRFRVDPEMLTVACHS